MRVRIGTQSEGTVDNGRLRAICECGWKGPWHLGLGESIGEADGDLAEHAAGHEDGAFREPFYVFSACGVAYHPSCGHHHALADDCPLSPDSPLGTLRSILQADHGDATGALRALQNAVHLSSLVHGLGTAAVIGAREAGASWDQVEAACAPLELDAGTRWVGTIRELEAVGVVGPTIRCGEPGAGIDCVLGD